MDPDRAGIIASADPWLTRREAAQHRGVSTRTLTRMIAAGTFPRPEPISPGKLGWRLSTVRNAPPAAQLSGRTPPKRGKAGATAPGSARRGGKLGGGHEHGR